MFSCKNHEKPKENNVFRQKPRKAQGKPMCLGKNQETPKET